jgi:DNA-binding NarL/FixJ family response regulator
LADSHDICRRGLRLLLSTRPGWQVCGEAKNGHDAAALCLALKPDVVILELELGGLNGIEVTRRVKRELPSVEILFYTAHNEENIVAEALRAGVRGHLLKTEDEARLIEAVEALGDHLPFFSTSATETIMEHVQKAGAESYETIFLTDREREIIRLLSEAKSNKEIAAELQISVKTVEAHRASVMRKLGFTSITELVRYAIRNGFIQP